MVLNFAQIFQDAGKKGKQSGLKAMFANQGQSDSLACEQTQVPNVLQKQEATRTNRQVNAQLSTESLSADMWPQESQSGLHCVCSICPTANKPKPKKAEVRTSPRKQKSPSPPAKRR